MIRGVDSTAGRYIQQVARQRMGNEIGI